MKRIFFISLCAVIIITTFIYIEQSKDKQTVLIAQPNKSGEAIIPSPSIHAEKETHSNTAKQ
jgi:hypothetical protein